MVTAQQLNACDDALAYNLRLIQTFKYFGPIITFTIIQIQKQATNYLFDIFSGVYIKQIYY